LKPDRRWNKASFPALYCCCSVPVARAVARDILKLGGVLLADLQPDHHPRLLEIRWAGTVVDVISNEGINSAGFAPTYPAGVDKDETRQRAETWHGQKGVEGVVCRSASLARLGRSEWRGAHEPWGELAIFVSKATEQPRLIRHHDELEWLDPA
jgi:hypothetical protein